MDSNKPLPEFYGEIGDQWADADAAASLLEDLKSAFLSQKMMEHTVHGVALNKAEMLVKASREWTDYIQKTVATRKNANKLKVKLEQIKMEHMKWQSEQANERVQARL